MKFPAFEAINLKNESEEFLLIELNVNQIHSDELQARKNFDEKLINDLALSIEKHGVISPIIVEKKNQGSEHYKIIAGERRWRAAKIAGLAKIPALVRSYQKKERMAVALIENIQRTDLNSLEEANAVNDLITQCDMTHQEVADSIGKSRSSVTNLLRILNLEPEVKKMLSLNQLELGHAKVLLGLTGIQQIEAAQIIAEKKMSVRESEKLISSILNPKDPQHFILDPKFESKLKAWQKNLSDSLSSKVNCHFGKEGQGRVVIHFNSIDEIHWLMEKISPENMK